MVLMWFMNILPGLFTVCESDDAAVCADSLNIPYTVMEEDVRIAHSKILNIQLH